MSSALAHPDSAPTGAELETLGPASREVAITNYLSSARDWLARAVEETGPEAIAAVKAEIATAAEATKQLNLSKEIQEDAVEMVRRAEYALGKAIRRGQEEGTVRTRGEREVIANQHGPSAEPVDNRNSKPSPYDFATPDELHGNGVGIYGLVDDVEPEQFEEALAAAKAEHNLSRANVVRKTKAKKEAAQKPDRLTRIREMAEQGYTSKQIGPELGISDGYVREIAREASITIPADVVTARSKGINSDRIVAQTVLELDAIAGSVELVEFSAVSRDQIEEWADSLLSSLRALTKFANRLKKESTQS